MRVDQQTKGPTVCKIDFGRSEQAVTRNKKPLTWLRHNYPGWYSMASDTPLNICFSQFDLIPVKKRNVCFLRSKYNKITKSKLKWLWLNLGIFALIINGFAHTAAVCVCHHSSKPQRTRQKTCLSQRVCLCFETRTFVFPAIACLGDHFW